MNFSYKNILPLCCAFVAIIILATGYERRATNLESVLGGKRPLYLLASPKPPKPPLKTYEGYFIYGGDDISLYQPYDSELKYYVWAEDDIMSSVIDEYKAIGATDTEEVRIKVKGRLYDESTGHDEKDIYDEGTTNKILYRKAKLYYGALEVVELLSLEREN